MEGQNRASEAKLHPYFEAASEGILVVSSAGLIQLVNRRAEEMFGYDRAELIGQPAEILLPERYRGCHVGLRDGYLAEPRLRPMGMGIDLAGRRKDGTEFPIEIGFSPVQSEEGMFALGLVSDITERHRAADQLARANADLQAREAQLRSYLEAALQGIIVVSGGGLIQLVNRRTEEMFGYDRSELIGQSLEILLPERFHARHVSHRSGYFAEPRPRAMGAGMDLSGRRKDGTEFPVEIGLSPVVSDEGTLTLGLVSDITERKRAADDLRRSNAELEQFAYAASHDLQEPLRMISSYLQLVERRYRGQLDADAQEFIHFAVDGATRMKGLIQDLLRISRAGTQEIDLKTVSGETLVIRAVGHLKAAIEECKAKVIWDPLPEIVGDATLLVQVLQNLIGNGIKFKGVETPYVHVSVASQDGTWVFSVRDNGIGIEPRHAERIFRIFERLHTSDQYPGSGVGLAISKTIVERHGGRIWFESVPGKGTTFYFSVSRSGKP